MTNEKSPPGQIALGLFPFLAVLLALHAAFSVEVRQAHGAADVEVVSEQVVRRAVSFQSEGETLRGWLYTPQSTPPGQRLPGVVTANALSGIKEINLPSYAERFAAAGYATLIFDYRYWGESDGEPRNHVAPMEHRADIRNALTFLTQQPEVDPARIGGWGISMGGGHMLFLSSWEPRFKAVAAVSTGIDPPVEGEPLSEEAAQARYDELAAAAEAERAARPTRNITPLQAWCPEPRSDCALPVKEAYDWYERARLTYAPAFQNRLTSTSFENMLADSVAFGIHLARAPILIVQPDHDVVPVEHVLFHYKRAAEPKRLVVLAGLHTTTYDGGRHLDTAAEESILWFRRYL